MVVEDDRGRRHLSPPVLFKEGPARPTYRARKLAEH
jgi:hypothetical protein